MGMFVGVHFRRAPTVFLFGPRKVHIFGDISFMASRGGDHARTPIMGWRSNGKRSILLEFARGSLTKKASDTPVQCSSMTRATITVADFAQTYSVRLAPSIK